MYKKISLPTDGSIYSPQEVKRVVKLTDQICEASLGLSAFENENHSIHNKYIGTLFNKRLSWYGFIK